MKLKLTHNNRSVRENDIVDFNFDLANCFPVIAGKTHPGDITRHSITRRVLIVHNVNGVVFGRHIGGGVQRSLPQQSDA